MGGTGAAMLRDQQVGFGVGFRQFLFQFAQGGLQVLDLGFLVFNLLREVGGHLTIAFDAKQGGAREIVVFLVNGELGFAHPFLHFFVVLHFLFFEQVLVGDGDCDLRFDLQELVLHVEDDLLDHLFRFFRLVDQIVQVGPDQSGYAFE